MPKRDLVRRIDQRKKATSSNMAFVDVSLALDELTDVECPDPVDDDIISRSGDYWINSPAIQHQVHLSMSLPSPATIAPGPCNITNRAYTIVAARFKSNGAVSGSIAPSAASFTLPVGGGVVQYGGMNTTWDVGTELILTISSEGTDGTYLAIDVAVK